MTTTKKAPYSRANDPIKIQTRPTKSQKASAACINIIKSDHSQWLLWSYLFPLPVPPRDPATAITTVFDLVHLGELVAHSSSVTALGAHKGDEVEGTQVNLEELRQVVWFNRYLRTPCTVSLLAVQPER